MKPETVVSNYPRTPETRYHAKTVTTWLRCLPFTLILFVVIIFLFDLARAGVGMGAPIDLIWITAVTYAGLLPLLAVCCRSFPITLSAGGLKAFKGLGVYSTISWEELRQLPVLNLGGLKYYRFKRDRMLLAILVPFDLKDRERFIREMARYIGDEHPIISNLCASWKMPVDNVQAVESTSWELPT